MFSMRNKENPIHTLIWRPALTSFFTSPMLNAACSVYRIFPSVSYHHVITSVGFLSFPAIFNIGPGTPLKHGHLLLVRNQF